MANPYFQFKRFMVWHDRCAMKVGTDGVLLGAWARVRDCRRALDVGTGTGLIALMLAQRSDALIDAIDIDLSACLQARGNVADSPFADRIRVHHASLSAFHPPTEGKYDLIVSNPPYFTETLGASLKCPDERRSIARHGESLPLPSLMRWSEEWLEENGNLAIILPFDQRDPALEAAKAAGLYLGRETWVASREGLRPKRWLAEFSLLPPLEVSSSQLAIETEDHHHTEAYIALVRDFYLKM